MKCPKCGYLGFESVDRCRNCGYEFSLSPSAGMPELSIRTASAGEHEEDSVGELPLFGSSVPDDEPLITKASPPRPPLAVRRSTPDAPRLRPEQARFQSMDP